MQLKIYLLPLITKLSDPKKGLVAKLQNFSEKILSLQELDKDNKKKELSNLEKEIRSFNETSKKTKEALFKQENELTMSILGRLSVFILESDSDKKLEKRQDFINETVEIIDLHIKKCDDYLKYNMDVLTQEADTEEEVEYK